ncbi:hypothetical protein [Streptomyces sp. CA-106110]|uniref:hypothetical protein n=1 Tax=Streptomyces sp. CA-106110 TaxID=3240044 RepID=UPI003D9443A5
MATTPFDAGTSALLILENHVTVPRNLEQRNALFHSLDVLTALVLGYKDREAAEVTDITIENAA